MKIVGIIGGGQLGMFLAISAHKMGYNTIVYTDKEDCPAKNITNSLIVGSFDDYDRLEYFCQQCHVITFEFENINSEIVEKLSIDYPIIQKAHPLILSSSRYNERNMANVLQIKQPKWQLINNTIELKQIKLEYPFLLKSDSQGYDGKGQYLINNSEDLNGIELNTSYLAEEKIDFDYEISVIGVQSIVDEILVYDPFYNIHEKGILKFTLINQEIPSIIIKKAKETVIKIMKQYKIYGLLCCEFFVKGDELFFNEMAARPHNSGHITMDTHYTSQFENHIRAICGLKLGSTNIKSNGFMVNVLGQNLGNCNEIMDIYGFEMKYYSYHKEVRNNRKIGHISVYDNKYYDIFKEWNNE